MSRTALGGADYLARIHGTEEDKVNCKFYFKVGACRHGDSCSRQHNKPPFSQTLILPNLWSNPVLALTVLNIDVMSVDPSDVQQAYDDFYFEMFEKFTSYGKIDELQICENHCEHMSGNVYVKFSDEEEAATALEDLKGKFYDGKLLRVEFSNVSDFREARCRQHDEAQCERGPHCNFMHVKKISQPLEKYLLKKFNYGVSSSHSSNIRSGRDSGRGNRERDNYGDRGNHGDRDNYSRPRGNSRDRRGY